MLAASVIVAAIAMVSACAVDHRSIDYTCGSSSDCNSGRKCIDNYCIVPGSIDASEACPSNCTSCTFETHTCTIECAKANCAAKVACPAGWACSVKCDVDGSCSNGVTCAGTTSCSVECTARNSCSEVACGTGKCLVTCSGAQACQNVRCNSSCACDVQCSGKGSCNTSPQCTGPTCRTLTPFPGCSSLSLNCRSC